MDVSKDDKETMEKALVSIKKVYAESDPQSKSVEMAGLRRLEELLGKCVQAKVDERRPMANLSALDEAVLATGALRKVELLKSVEDYPGWRDRNIALANLRGVKDSELVPYLLVHLSAELFSMVKSLNWTEETLHDSSLGIPMLDKALGLDPNPVVSRLRLRQLKQAHGTSVRHFAAEIRNKLERSGLYNAPGNREAFNREAW